MAAPIKRFYFVDDHGQSIAVTGKGEFGDSEPPYDECDFDYLTGLIVYEGEELTPEEWAERKKRPANQGYDFYWDGAWRQATADEAITLGIVSAPSASAGEERSGE